VTTDVFDTEPEAPPFLVEPFQTVGIFLAIVGVVVMLSFALYAWLRRNDIQAARRGIFGVLGGFLPLLLGILFFWLV